MIELFATHLAKVQFPDIDAAALRKLAEDVRTEAATVARARDALAAAIAASDARVATLTAACTRAVAYAKVFSEAQPERRPIADALAALDEPVARVAPRPGKRRGRPPKVATTTELFDTSRSEASDRSPAVR